MSHAAVAMFTTDVERVCVACGVRDDVEACVLYRVRSETEETVERTACIQISRVS
jgi:hypothetical protein